MKFAKLLIVPAVLLLSVVVAVPASAHQLTNATVTVACQTSTGQVCVTFAGDIASDNAARNVTFALFAQGSDTALDMITFDLPAFDSSANASNHFKQTLCFKAITDNVASFVIKVVKVTDTKGNLSDLAIQLNGHEIAFTPDHQPATQVGESGKCTASTPPPSSGGSGAGSTTPSTSAPPANTTVALAQTGGFDFRYPLIGLVLLVAGGALYVVSASRGRSARSR